MCFCKGLRGFGFQGGEFSVRRLLRLTTLPKGLNIQTPTHSPTDPSPIGPLECAQPEDPFCSVGALGYVYLAVLLSSWPISL